MDEAIAKHKASNDQLITESNRLKIRLSAATSDAEYILLHKESEIDRKEMIIKLNQENFDRLREEKEERNGRIEALRTEILEKQQALKEADEVIKQKAKLDHEMQEVLALLHRQEAKMKEKEELIEEKKKELERARVTTKGLEVRAASRAETKILFGEQWLVSSRRYRAGGTTATQQLPSARQGNVAAVLGGKHMVLLGGKPEQPHRDMQMMTWAADPPRWENPDAGVFAPVMRTVVWRCGAVACATGGGQQLFYFGGLGKPGQVDDGGDDDRTPTVPGYTVTGKLTNDIHVFNLSSKKFGKITAVKGMQPSPRMFHCGAMSEDGTQMFVFGGSDAQGLCSDTWVFSKNTNQWTCLSSDSTPCPSPRMGASVCAMKDGKRLFLFGGFDGAGTLDDVWVFEIDRRSWKREKIVGAASPLTRYGHVATVISDRYMLVSGGTHVEEGEGGPASSASPVQGAPPRTALLDTWVLDLESYQWETLHEAAVPARASLRPEVTYAAYHAVEGQHKIIYVKPSPDEALDEVEVVDLFLPEDIEEQKLQARKESDIIASLEILPESEPVAFEAYDEGEIRRAKALGQEPQRYLAGAVMLRWSVPTKNNDHVVGYKIMMRSKVGVTSEVGYGPAVDFAVSPRLAQFLVTGLRVGQEVQLVVKAIYDDGSFLWSQPRSFFVPRSANKVIKDRELVDRDALVHDEPPGALLELHAPGRERGDSEFSAA